MLKSMTGYGRAKEIIGTKEVTVEVRSVNHRYFDYSARVPRSYGFLEEKMKSKLSAYVSRGKLDVYVGINSIGDSDTEIKVNTALLDTYYNALKTVAAHKGVKNDISVSLLSKYSDIFAVDRKEESADEIWAAVEPVADKALEAYNEMRLTEGKRMFDDLSARAQNILNWVGEIEVLSKKSVPEYKDKLTARIRELLADVGVAVDEARLLNELAIYADKIAVDEETVRLRSHLAQYETMLQSNEPIGRKLDFLIQEMNREINTTGSKASNIEIAKIVVDVKAEIEKIREQVQNIE